MMPQKPNIMSRHAAPAHKSAARLLGYALTSATFDGWETASAIWQARLTPEERAALAWAALRSLDPDDADKVSMSVCGGAGVPLPPLVDPVADAAWWALRASADERAAYCLAAFNAMPHSRQLAFLDHVQGRQAA